MENAKDCGPKRCESLGRLRVLAYVSSSSPESHELLDKEPERSARIETDDVLDVCTCEYVVFDQVDN